MNWVRPERRSRVQEPLRWPSNGINGMLVPTSLLTLVYLVVKVKQYMTTGAVATSGCWINGGKNGWIGWPPIWQQEPWRRPAIKRDERNAATWYKQWHEASPMFKFFPPDQKLIPIITIDCCRQLQVARLLHLVKHCCLSCAQFSSTLCACFHQPPRLSVSFFLFQIQSVEFISWYCREM